MTFRIPYWDWAYNATMPDVVNQPYVSINTPQGFMNVVNPLYNYTFHPQPSASDFPPATSLAKYHSTVRYPDANGHSQPAKSNAQLQANAQPLHDLTYQLIAEQSNYAPFSNAAYSDGRGNSYNSIENMHNAIHSLVGQTGHMAIISYSSFDPIFWLHHANVDRLIAIWQAIHPESFTISQVNQDGTYTNAPAMTEDEHTPLTPFHSDNNGTFYTSVTARYTRHFGYTYPEIIDWDVNSTQLFSNVRRNLNLLYNPSGSLSSRSLAVARMPDHMPREEEPNLLNKDGAGIWVAPASPSRALTLGKEDNASRPLNTTKGKAESANYQYFVNIRVDKTALNQSFFIHFFLGPCPSLKTPSSKTIHFSFFPHKTPPSPSSPPFSSSSSLFHQRCENHALTAPSSLLFLLGTVPSNPTLWSTSPTLIASQSILYYPSFSLSPTSSNITNNNKNKNNNNTNHYHQRPTNRTTYGQIPLTHALHSPFHPTSIIPHLRTHLQWRIQTFDNTPVDINASSTTLSALKASLKIFVVGRKVVSEARDDLFPVYGALRVHREATRGKAGGIGLEDEREESEDKDEEQEEGI